jgi:hypothetical protein
MSVPGLSPADTAQRGYSNRRVMRGAARLTLNGKMLRSSAYCMRLWGCRTGSSVGSDALDILASRKLQFGSHRISRLMRVQASFISRMSHLSKDAVRSSRLRKTVVDGRDTL